MRRQVHLFLLALPLLLLAQCEEPHHCVLNQRTPKPTRLLKCDLPAPARLAGLRVKGVLARRQIWLAHVARRAFESQFARLVGAIAHRVYSSAPYPTL